MPRIGVDIVDISEVRTKIARTNGWLQKILSDTEIEGRGLESACGLIAVKEAVMKTGVIKPGKWLDIQVSHTDEGEPVILNSAGERIEGLSVSISHVKHTAVAVAIYEKN